MPLTANQKAVLDQGSYRKAILIEINFASGPLRMWSEPDDASIDVGSGAVTWEGSHVWIGFDPLEQGIDGALTDFSVTLGGLDTALINDILQEDVEHRLMRVYLALLDGQGAIVDTPVILLEREQNVGEYLRDGRTASIEVTGVDRRARHLRAGYEVFAEASQRDYALSEAGITDSSADSVGVQTATSVHFPGPKWVDRRKQRELS